MMVLNRGLRIVGLAGPCVWACFATVASPVQPDAPPGTGRVASPGYFVFIYRPGPAWVKGRTVREQPALAEHIVHMTKLEQNGTLVLGGPFKGDMGAMGILQGENLVAAQNAVMNDPMVKAGVVTAEVHPWHPAVAGRVETRPW